jgi:hypothetical protein
MENKKDIKTKWYHITALIGLLGTIIWIFLLAITYINFIGFKIILLFLFLVVSIKIINIITKSKIKILLYVGNIIAIVWVGGVILAFLAGFISAFL